MALRATMFSRRLGAALTVGTVVLAGAIVPTGIANAAVSPRHDPGLYISVGQPTQLNRGQINASGELTMEAVGAPAATTYNALAAHLPSASLYAVADTNGQLLRVLDDGSVESVVGSEGDPVSVGSSSSAATFGEGALQDQLFYVVKNGRELGCFDVVAAQQCGVRVLSPAFVPIDMAWNGGYFWGLSGAGTEAKLSRVSLDGVVTTAAIPALDATKVKGGSFGAAWTYGNGNLGFMSNGGGSVQIRVTATEPIAAEVVGYSTGEVSKQLDGAMIPPSPGDVAVAATSRWTGTGDTHRVTATVRNVGATPVTGYQLGLAPDAADTRAVAGLSTCSAVAGAFRCIGGALEPGEERSLQFELAGPGDAAVVAAQWTARVELNEVDLNPANNAAVFAPVVPAPIDVHTEVKARVMDTNNDGLASSGEKIEVYVLVENNSPETLTGIAVQLDSIIPQTQAVTGQILPGARRTIKFANVVPQLGPEIGEIILSSLSAHANGVPVSARSGELIVLGEGARPVIQPPAKPVDPSAASSTSDAAAGSAAAGVASEGAAQAAGSGSAANGEENGPGGAGAVELSATGASNRSPVFATLGLCLLLALAVGGAGLRRSRRQVRA